MDYVIGTKKLIRLERELVTYQKPDGSWGSSISLTAMALPAMSGHSPVDISLGHCRKIHFPVENRTPPGKVEIFYEIRDEVTYSQTLSGRFYAPANRYMLNAITALKNESNGLIEYKLVKTGFGYIMISLMGIDNKPPYGWTVHRIKNGSTSEEYIVQGLDRMRARDGDLYIFKYRNVYKV